MINLGKTYDKDFFSDFFL